MTTRDPRYNDAIDLLQALAQGGYESRLAGGCVRDRLLGIEPGDFDVASVATPEQVTELLQKRWKVVPTGIEHGTVTVVMKHGPVEVTTLRIDVTTDGRRAEVAFSDSFEEDASRRDFTVNAMFEDASGKIYDYHGGQGDLKAKALCFVGDAKARIEEDYLRILRLFRFWSKLGFVPDHETLVVVAEQASQLHLISQERKTSEMWKLFCADHPYPALRSMYDTGVLQHVLPGTGIQEPREDVQDALKKLDSSLRPIAWLLWLLGIAEGDDANDSSLPEMARTLRISNEETRQLLGWSAQWGALANPYDAREDQMDFVDRVEAAGGSLSDFVLSFSVAQSAKNTGRQENLRAIERTEAVHGHLRRRQMPVNGSDVATWLGISPGPAIGGHLTALKQAFRRGEWAEKGEAKVWLMSHKDS